MRKNKKSNQQINENTLLESDQVAALLKPTLIWPNFIMRDYSAEIIEKDEYEFCYSLGFDIQLKNYKEFKANHGICPGSNEFWKKFRESKNIIFWDKFFDVEAIERVDYELNLISKDVLDNKIDKEIYILCGNDIDKVKNKYDDFCKQDSDIYTRNLIKIHSVRDKDWFHDRFAIMDQEIWHCGSTVGGIEPCMNVLSRGWFDKDNKLRKFFLKAVDIYE